MPIAFMSTNGHRRQWILQLLLLIVLASTEVSKLCIIAEATLLPELQGNTPNSSSMHIPLYRTEARKYTKRDQHHAEIGVGDDLDM